MLDEPRIIAAQLPWAPPLIELGKRLGWDPLPLTIKEGRVFARGLSDRIEPAPHPDHRRVGCARPR